MEFRSRRPELRSNRSFRFPLTRGRFPSIRTRADDGIRARYSESVNYGINSKAILSVFKDVKHILNITIKVNVNGCE